MAGNWFRKTGSVRMPPMTPWSTRIDEVSRELLKLLYPTDRSCSQGGGTLTIPKEKKIASSYSTDSPVEGLAS